MTTHVAIDESRLKAAVQEVQDRKHPGINHGLSIRPPIAGLRHDLEKQLQPLFANVGIDTAKIKQIMTKHETEVRHILEKQKVDTSKEFAAQARIVQQGIENKKKALELLANKAYITTPIPIFTPYTIYSQPAGMVKDSHIEPSLNWAKFKFQDNTDQSSTTVKVSFFFAWQNPSNYEAVINCAADLQCSGTAHVFANGGDIPLEGLSGTADLTLSARLNVFLGETERDASVPVSYLSAYAHFLDDVEERKNILDIFHLAQAFVLVQPTQIVVFEVAFVAVYDIDSGFIDFDFSSDIFARIMCPALQIDLLTAPAKTM